MFWKSYCYFTISNNTILVLTDFMYLKYYNSKTVYRRKTILAYRLNTKDVCAKH